MKNPLESEEARWTLLTTGSAILGAVVVRSLLKKGWQVWRHEDPPNNPADPDVSWQDALIWAGVTGAAAAVGRVVARRLAAEGWERSTGQLPPVV